MPRVDARQAEPALQERNDAEGRQVPLVEHDGIAQRDRTRVVGLRIEEVEQLARSLAVAPIPVDETLAIDWDCGSYEDKASPFNALVRS